MKVEAIEYVIYDNTPPHTKASWKRNMDTMSKQLNKKLKPIVLKAYNMLYNLTYCYKRSEVAIEISQRLGTI